MIELSVELANLLEREHITAHLLTIYLDNSPIYLTDAPHDVTYAGTTYQGGLLERVPNFEINGEIKVGESSFVLSAVNSELTALFLQAPWLNRKVELRRAYFKPDFTLVGAMQIWQGLLTARNGVESSNKATMTLKAASVWADFAASRGRRTNHESQQIHHPGDRGFEFCGVVQSDLDWGQKSLSGSGPVGGGGGSRGGGERQYQRH